MQDEWDKAVQKKRVSNEGTRNKTMALNTNLREAMYADDDDYNEVKGCLFVCLISGIICLPGHLHYIGY